MFIFFYCILTDERMDIFAIWTGRPRAHNLSKVFRSKSRNQKNDMRCPELQVLTEDCSPHFKLMYQQMLLRSSVFCLLVMGDCSEKCLFRTFYHCVNIIAYTYADLGGLAQ